MPKLYSTILTTLLFSTMLQAQNAPIKVACVGNSITFGAGIKNPQKDAYPVVLGKMLGSGYEVKNFGRSGATLLRKGNKPYWAQDVYQKAKEYQPDLVIIKLGSNDTKAVNQPYWDEYEQDLSDLMDTFSLLSTHPKIYLCLPVPAFGQGNFGITDTALVNTIIPKIKKVADKKKAGLVDLHTALLNRPELFPDRVHPNEAGALVLANKVYYALTGRNGDSALRQIPAYQSKQHINIRGNLNNCRYVFNKEKVGRVAFLGGSITEMKGWHNLIMEQLKARYPNTQFQFIEAGIGSTGTTPGAFRIEKDVLENGKIDLLFVEAAVNDHTNGFDSLAQIRGMEGEVRHALLSNPMTDIVMLHFIYDPFIPMLNKGTTPDVILNHEKVAEYYQIPSINLAQEIAERMQANEFDWQLFGGTHPAPLGHYYYAQSIASLFDKMWPVNQKDKLSPHKIPKHPLNQFSYFKGKLIGPSAANIKQGWKLQSPWTPTEPANVRDRFKGATILEALTPDAEMTLGFKGTAVGIYTLCGPDAGTIYYSIDGQRAKTLDLYTKWSKNLYIPWLYMLEAELKDTKHTLTLKMSADKNKESKGTAAQIYYFAVNGGK